MGKINYMHSNAALKVCVSVYILQLLLSQSLLPVFNIIFPAPLSGWQAKCVENSRDVPSGSISSVETRHFGFIPLQRLVCGYAAFSLRNRERDTGMERQHQSNCRGLQRLLRGSQRHLYQQDLCRQHNECNRFRPGPGDHLLFCGDRVCCFGFGKSVLGRSVLPGSFECPDYELFQHLYRRYLHKLLPVQDKLAVVWNEYRLAAPIGSHEFCFRRFLDLFPPNGRVDTSIKLESADMD